MVKALPAVKAVTRSPMKIAARSPFRALQLQPERYYQTTWDLSPQTDFTQTWNGLFGWDRVTEVWTAFSLTNQQQYFIDLTVQEEAANVDFEIIDAAGNVVDTETIALAKRTWLMRFREWQLIGEDRSLRIDHWYSKVSGWTPKGEYTLLLQASPNQPFPDPIRFNGPYTLTPTAL